MKKGYSTNGDLRFVNQPFVIVNECIKHIMRTNEIWKGRIRFIRGEEQVEIPAVGGLIVKRNEAWATLLGWRHLSSPILNPVERNQLVSF